MSTFLDKIFCQHHFELINEIEMKSEAEIVKDLGYTVNSWHKLVRVVVTDYTCLKCGKLKRLKVKTPS